MVHQCSQLPDRGRPRRALSSQSAGLYETCAFLLALVAHLTFMSRFLCNPQFPDNFQAASKWAYPVLHNCLHILIAWHNLSCDCAVMQWVDCRRGKHWKQLWRATWGLCWQACG